MRASRLGPALGLAGSVPGSLGVRMAFEPGHGRTAVPVRSALAGTSVAEYAGGNYGQVSVAAPGSRSGTAVPAIGLDQLHGNGFLTLLAGRAPAGPHEITLGPRTLRELGLRIGQRVEVGANDRITPMRIVARRSSQRSAWAAARTSTPAGRTRNAAKHSSPCCSTGPKARPRQ